jgi:UDP-2-acetamido-2-deoxy-ribo-hexuluronate aminotransferase
MWKALSNRPIWMQAFMIQDIKFNDLNMQYTEQKKSIDDRIQKVLNHGQYIMGPEVSELENTLESYTGSKHCITVASGTEALLIALMSIGIEMGDEVITTPFSFASTTEVIALLGAIPVFVDVDEHTCNIDSNLIEAAITSKTKAIIPVSLYGQTSNMDEINEIAFRNGQIPVVEDAAQSFGAIYKSKKSCNLSTIGCTSFFPSKPLGCYGDGGAIFTNDDELEKKIREIRVHGQERRYFHTRIGVGGRMDTLQCAIVLAKIEKFPWEINRRIEAGKHYLELLSIFPRIRKIYVPTDRTCVWGQFTVHVENRGKIQKILDAIGLPTSVHYPIPLHHQPAYRDLCRISGDLKKAEAVSKTVLSLPMHPYITKEAQEIIVKNLVKAAS